VRKSGIAVVVAGALALALAACGGGSAKPASNTTRARTRTTSPTSSVAGRKIVLTSITTTAAAKTARTDVEVKMSGVSANGSKGAFTISATGVAEFGSGDSQTTMTIDGPVGKIAGDEFEVRTLDGVVYVRVPAGLDVPGADGKPWVAVTPSAGSADTTSPFGLSGQTDPTKVLAYLEKVSDDVQVVGSEQVRGVDTTHYHATLSLAKTIDENSDKVPAGLRDSIKSLAGLFGNMPADVWIDGDGRLRRLSLEIDLGAMFRGFETTGTTTADNLVITETMDLYDFGTPVHVEAPPADQVAHFSGSLPPLNGDASG
jgi:hypothetical protein